MTPRQKKWLNGALNTEALRLARRRIKKELRRAGHKLSHFEGVEITRAARALIAADKCYLGLAKRNLRKAGYNV